MGVLISIQPLGFVLQDEPQRRIAKLTVHEILRAEIVDALVRDGVDLEGDANRSG